MREGASRRASECGRSGEGPNARQREKSNLRADELACARQVEPSIFERWKRRRARAEAHRRAHLRSRRELGPTSAPLFVGNMSLGAHPDLASRLARAFAPHGVVGHRAYSPRVGVPTPPAFTLTRSFPAPCTSRRRLLRDVQVHGSRARVQSRRAPRRHRGGPPTGGPRRRDPRRGVHVQLRRHDPARRVESRQRPRHGGVLQTRRRPSLQRLRRRMDVQDRRRSRGVRARAVVSLRRPGRDRRRLRRSPQRLVPPRLVVHLRQGAQVRGRSRSRFQP